MFARPSWLLSRQERDDRSRDLEQTVPLTGLHGHALDDNDDEDDDLPPPVPSKRPPSQARRPLKRYLLLALSVASLVYAVDYLYSDPERWTQSWSQLLLDPRPGLVDPVVRAAGAVWRGERRASDKFLSYRALPYAQSPVGALRFRVAAPLAMGTMPTEEEWTRMNLTDAFVDDEGCPRPDPDDETKIRYVGVEDCLKLNVFTPRRRLPGVKLPVMIWIHGGGFYAGKALEAKYEARDLMHRAISMNQPFVMVSINYRLSTLGFSATPPLPGPFPLPPHIPTGPPPDLDLNVGFKDQIEAMRWVRREIGNFGGDPDKVTLVGNSAGAISIGLHQLYSPPELFRGAFMMSGAPTSFPVPFPHDAAARTIHPLPGSSNCPYPVHVQPGTPPSNSLLIDCLRTLPLDELMHASKVLLEHAGNNAFFPWYPVLEGDWEGSWLTFRPSDMIVRGTFSKIPVVLGSVLDEGTRFTGVETKTEKDMLYILQGIFTFTYGAVESILTPILELYPDDPAVGSPFHTSTNIFGLSTSYKRAASLVGDIFFRAPIRHFLRETPKDFGEPSWSYSYEQVQEGIDPRMGVNHGVDCNSWFGHPLSKKEEAKHLSRHMSAYLINFIAHLDPNGPGLHYWPQYGEKRRMLRLARHNISVVHDDDRLEPMKFLNVNNPLLSR